MFNTVATSRWWWWCQWSVMMWWVIGGDVGWYAIDIGRPRRAYGNAAGNDREGDPGGY